MTLSAVVTGAGAGLGLAIAERLAHEGWRVAGIERDEASAARFVSRLGEAGSILHGDVRDGETLESAAREAENRGELSGWVNNAAVIKRGNLHEPNRTEVQEILAINVEAPFWGSSVAIRSFLQHGVAGRILNVSSIHATHAFPSFAAYDTSKGAINALTRYIAVEYGPAGIRANAIAPGAIATEMLSEVIRNAPDPAREECDMASLHPLDRLGTPEEVAAAATFLLSEESSFVSGQVLGVDGGGSARAFRFETELQREMASRRDGPEAVERR